MSADSIVYGESNVVVNNAGAGYATPEEILKIGRGIWKQIQESGIDVRDEDGNDRLLESLQKDNRDFATSFPLVLRWAVQLRKFSGSAFEKYLRLHASSKLDSREAFIALQAEYPVFLFREENARRHDEKAAQAFRADLVKRLLEEDKTFQDMQKEAEAEAKELAAGVDKERRQKLFEFISAAKLANKVAQETP
jgi:hypothetical protein